MTPRYVTATTTSWLNVSPDPIPLEDEMEEDDRYRLYRLCQCSECGGSAKVDGRRCRTCRGEGRTLDCVATATDPESVGVALITLALEDEFDGCPFGLMDRPKGQTGRWLVKPWGASPRNVSDAGKVLRSARHA